MNFSRRARCQIGIFIVTAGLLLIPASTHAAESRSALLFEINTAVKARDGRALLACFALDESVDEPTRAAIVTAVRQIISWPTHHLDESDRANTGPIDIERDEKTYTLNGDWSFQVHIHVTKPPSRGFVFPAGVTPDGRWAVLVSVPKS